MFIDQTTFALNAFVNQLEHCAFLYNFLLTIFVLKILHLSNSDSSIQVGKGMDKLAIKTCFQNSKKSVTRL